MFALWDFINYKAFSQEQKLLKPFYEVKITDTNTHQRLNQKKKNYRLVSLKNIYFKKLK